MTFAILHDYHPVHHSGQREYHDIAWLVVHDMESTNPTGAAEGAGSWFENAASGGSTHFGADENSLQQYLGLRTIAWGAPNANLNGVHYEMMGKASWSTSQWKAKAPGTIEKTAYALAWTHLRLKRNGVHVPLSQMGDSALRAHHHGVTTHRQVTRALGGGTHTDPGPDFPMRFLLERARYWAGKLA